MDVRGTVVDLVRQPSAVSSVGSFLMAKSVCLVGGERFRATFAFFLHDTSGIHGKQAVVLYIAIFVFVLFVTPLAVNDGEFHFGSAFRYYGARVIVVAHVAGVVCFNTTVRGDSKGGSLSDTEGQACKRFTT